MSGLGSAVVALAVLGTGAWIGMAVTVRRAGPGRAAPWRPGELLEEYATLQDLGRASPLWPALLALAAVGMVAVALLVLARW